MSIATMPTEEKVAVLLAVANARYPRIALPTIAGNHQLTLAELQNFLAVHGYPKPERLKEAAAKLANEAAEAADPDIAEEPAPAEAAPAYVTALPVTSLFADLTYQRELDETRVARMVREYNPALIGLVEVSDRGDGTFAILDGQHRVATLKDWSFTRTDDTPHVACNVHSGLTIEAEAKLYHQLNTTRRSLTGWDRWVARRAAHDQVVLGVEAVVKDCGFETGTAAKAGVLRSTASAEKVYKLGGPGLLATVLNLIRGAWGTDQTGLDGAIVLGLGQILDNYSWGERDAEIDLDRLMASMQSVLPRQLTARANAVREIQKGTVDRLVAHVIVENYNIPRPGRIEPFFERVKPQTKTRSSQSKVARRHAVIREWAIEQGLMMPGQGGRLARTIIEAWEAAHPRHEVLEAVAS